MKPKALVWFGNNLRVEDNEMLFKASRTYRIYPVFIFDPRHYAVDDRLGFTKTGFFKTKFLIESVKDLRVSLQKRGTDLIVRTGHPEDIIPGLAAEIGVQKVFVGKEVTADEVAVEQETEKKLFVRSVPLELVWQSTLFHSDDVPWPIRQVPEVFTKFRKESEKTVTVRPLFGKPEKLEVPDYPAGNIPEPEELGVVPRKADRRTVMRFKGGERAARARLNEYFQSDRLKTYKATRNGLIGSDYSSKLSPWLAVGAISAKSVYFEIKKYESERVKNQSTYWLFFELLWRDFFKFMAKKHGAKIFRLNGLSAFEFSLTGDKAAFERWRLAKTGEPFIDANMKELLLTGFISNRGRQIVASYLIHQLKVNWTWGAAWFEHALVDYDAASNWLNWAYIAGVGNDPRNGRVFNVESQQQRYDPKGEYVDLWQG